MSTDNGTLMKELKAIIKNSDYDQKDLAKIAGVTGPTMSKYLNNQHEMPVFVFAEIVKALGVSADALLFSDTEVKAKEKKPAGPPEVLDALQVIMETMEPAIELRPYTVVKTEFDDSKAEYTLGNHGEEFVSSAFYNAEIKYKAICINCEAVQEMLDNWDNYLKATEGTPHLKALFQEKIFDDEIEKAKGFYDEIEPMTGAFNVTDYHLAILSTEGSKVPYSLSNFDFGLCSKVFQKLIGNNAPDECPDYALADFDYEIPNKNRDVFVHNGYSLESLDRALVSDDLSKLERDSIYKMKVSK